MDTVSALGVKEQTLTKEQKAFLDQNAYLNLGV
jgi:hypothetical protein